MADATATPAPVTPCACCPKGGWDDFISRAEARRAATHAATEAFEDAIAARLANKPSKPSQR